MKNFKKITCVLLSSGLTLASIAGTTAFASPNVSIQDSKDLIISENYGEPYMPTYYMTWFNKSQTASTNNTVAVYDLYAKVDTEPFSESFYEEVEYPSGHKITNFTCRLANEDGSYIVPEIIGFEPAQLCHYVAKFPKNGEYTCSLTASTGIDGSYKLDVTEVSGYSYTTDNTPPTLSLKRTAQSAYTPGTPVIIYISADELCSVEFNGKTFKECNYVECPIDSNGTYKVTATDKSGNVSTKEFEITYMTSADQNLLYGDANVDGNVTLADSTAILQSISNPDKYKLSSEGEKNADCFSPGSGITANDALAIRELYAGIIDSLPVLS